MAKSAKKSITKAEIFDTVAKETGHPKAEVNHGTEIDVFLAAKTLEITAHQKPGSPPFEIPSHRAGNRMAPRSGRDPHLISPERDRSIDDTVVA